MSSTQGIIYILQNKKIRVEINSIGAELWSIRDCKGREYLWQGDSKYWENRSPNLFPYIGRLTEGKYSYQGETYQLDIHGFLKDSELHVLKRSDTAIVFELNNLEVSYKQYPFLFNLKIIIQLVENKIKIKYIVKNMDSKSIYFAIGGHPGFNVPLEEGHKFEEYYIEFLGEKELEQIEMTDDCFVKGGTSVIPLQAGGKLWLQHDMFNKDAIIVKRTFNKIRLGRGSGTSIEIICPSMQYLGIWHTPNSEAPYVCLEPWTSLPSRKGEIENIAFQKDMVMLNEKNIYENQWEIVIEGE